jgi:hypothetical protein
MSRRRRGGKTAAFEDVERNLFLRILLRSPKDTFAGATAFALVVAIIANALFLQAGRHPAPMFGSVTLHSAGATPPALAVVPRPPGAIPVISHSDSAANAVIGSRRVAAVQRALTDYGYGQLKPTGIMGPDTQAAIQKFERARKLPVTGQLSDRLVRELTATIGHPID